MTASGRIHRDHAHWRHERTTVYFTENPYELADDTASCPHCLELAAEYRAANEGDQSTEPPF